MCDFMVWHYYMQVWVLYIVQALFRIFISWTNADLLPMDSQNKFKYNLKQNMRFFHKENSLETVVFKMLAILSREAWVNG